MAVESGPMARKSTARDVAELAGTSRSAVSMVLNGRAEGMVAKDAQERIRNAAEKLNYTPNQIARSLRDQRSHVIGLVSNSAVTSAFDGAIIAGADQLARSHGFVTLATDTEQDDERTTGAIRTLLDRQVDALIYLTVGLSQVRVPEGFKQLPSALVNCFPAAGAGDIAAFIPDEVAGGAMAAAHLISLGHTRIAFLGGDHTTPAVARREQGFREAMASAGLPVRENWVIQAGWDISRGYAAARRILDADRSRRPTAVLAGNDRSAIGMVLAAGSLGLRVPDDVSIMGYDDEARIADTMVPTLSSVTLPQFRMGREAMAAVLTRLGVEALEGAAGGDLTEDPVRPETRLVPCRLVVRGSTGRAPA